MDNEVYIDDCNVAECKYTNGLYKGVYGCINLNLNPACSKNPNCYYKQLQRAKAENEKLKEWLENKEKAYNHLCNVNNRKKEQIKNLNYMLFEEKEMTIQEWKLKYRLANKERKFIQYKEITNKRLNNYKQALEKIKKYIKDNDLYRGIEIGYIRCDIELLKKIDEVLDESEEK